MKNNYICERFILDIFQMKHMMRRSLYLIISLLIWSVGLHAQDEKKKVDFVYDVNFEMNFDNREF